MGLFMQTHWPCSNQQLKLKNSPGNRVKVEKKREIAQQNSMNQELNIATIKIIQNI